MTPVAKSQAPTWAGNGSASPSRSDRRWRRRFPSASSQRVRTQRRCAKSRATVVWSGASRPVGSARMPVARNPSASRYRPRTAAGERSSSSGRSETSSRTPRIPDLSRIHRRGVRGHDDHQVQVRRRRQGGVVRQPTRRPVEVGAAEAGRRRGLLGHPAPGRGFGVADEHHHPISDECRTCDTVAGRGSAARAPLLRDRRPSASRWSTQRLAPLQVGLDLLAAQPSRPQLAAGGQDQLVAVVG